MTATLSTANSSAADFVAATTDFSIILAAVQHGDDELRLAAAINPVTPSPILSALAFDSVPAIRTAAASHVLATLETIDAVAENDPDVTVRAAARVIRNARIGA